MGSRFKRGRAGGGFANTCGLQAAGRPGVFPPLRARCPERRPQTARAHRANCTGSDLEGRAAAATARLCYPGAHASRGRTRGGAFSAGTTNRGGRCPRGPRGRLGGGGRAPGPGRGVPGAAHGRAPLRAPPAGAAPTLPRLRTRAASAPSLRVPIRGAREGRTSRRRARRSPGSPRRQPRQRASPGRGEVLGTWAAPGRPPFREGQAARARARRSAPSRSSRQARCRPCAPDPRCAHRTRPLGLRRRLSAPLGSGGGRGTTTRAARPAPPEPRPLEPRLPGAPPRRTRPRPRAPSLSPAGCSALGKRKSAPGALVVPPRGRPGLQALPPPGSGAPGLGPPQGGGRAGLRASRARRTDRPSGGWGSRPWPLTVG